jgi:regulator of protease activity HflC (stomatin/prohibitin superfamily)
MFLYGLIAGVVIFVWWKARDAWFRVEEGQVGLLLRFGAALQEGSQPKLFGPGLHFKWSFDEVRIVSLREQLMTLGHGEAVEHAMLNDGTVIRLQSMLRYTPRRDGIAKYVFGLHHRREHVTTLFTSLLRNELANVKASGPTLDNPNDLPEENSSFALVRRDRSLLNRRIADFARSTFGDLYGVDFHSVDITDIHPPDELADALNAVISARSEADSIRFRAESDCAQKTMAAEQGVAIATAKAAAVEAEIDELGRNLLALEKAGVLDTYVERRRAEVLSDARTVFVKAAGAGAVVPNGRPAPRAPESEVQ